MIHASHNGSRSRSLVLPLLVMHLVLVLAACGATGPSAVDPSAAPVTEFDEPEQRKRARLRMELASGYFEQGRTDIELDEIKQARPMLPMRLPTSFAA